MTKIRDLLKENDRMRKLDDRIIARYIEPAIDKLDQFADNMDESALVQQIIDFLKAKYRL